MRYAQDVQTLTQRSSSAAPVKNLYLNTYRCGFHERKRSNSSKVNKFPYIKKYRLVFCVIVNFFVFLGLDRKNYVLFVEYFGQLASSPRTQPLLISFNHLNRTLRSGIQSHTVVKSSFHQKRTNPAVQNVCSLSRRNSISRQL